MSHPAGTLNCPKCGAAASPDATACTYCATPLALVACPSCFAKIFRGAKHCSHCGAETARVEAARAGSLACPRCRAELDRVLVGEIPLDECVACGGVWVDAGSFTRICAEREHQSIILGIASSDPPRTTGSLPVRYLPCPTCTRLMNRVNFAHCSGVIVDVCKNHGTWFDANELRQIVEFIRAGGFDLAREKQRREIEDERRRLREQELALAAKIRYSANQPHGGGAREMPDLGLIIAAARGVLKHLK